MTKREMFETIATVNADNAEIVAFCEHEIELLNARKSAKRSLTPTQKANLAVKDTIMAILEEAEEAMSIPEMREHEELAGYTPQKISALLTQLIKEERVVREMDKKTAKFKAIA